MSPDRSAEIAAFLIESDEWLSSYRLAPEQAIRLAWPAATPAEAERAISIAEELWRVDKHEVQLGAPRGRRA